MKKYAKIFGWLISALCLVFFIHHVSDVGLSVPGRTPLEIIFFVAAGAFVYALGVLALSLAWWAMLRPETARANSWKLIRSYLMGQFAKYLPGNVFQFAARHSMSTAAGASHSSLIGAAFAEIYLLLCCGSAIAIAAASPVLGNIAPSLPTFPAWLGFLPLALVFAVSSPRQIAPGLRWLPRLPVRTVVAASFGYTVFFLIFGALYLVCLVWIAGAVPDAVAAVGSAAVAWIAGFVIPGPPAGAGVREAALTLGAGSQLPPAMVAASIILFRVLTLGGDLIAFLGGFLMGTRNRS